ncbi:MAG: YlcI/YnfO family protein [Gammaproteobacteria bacterium]
MKTATLPLSQGDSALRQAAESVLQEGETLSSFIEQSVHTQVQLRQQQEAFIARGLAARDSACKFGRYVAAQDVVAGLQARLDKARKA